jgi:hypothetical protein
MSSILIDAAQRGHCRIAALHGGQCLIDAVHRIFWQGSDEGFKRLIEIVGVL